MSARSRRRSPIFAQAVAFWHQVRAEFELYREAQYTRAETELNSVLLNRRGKRARIDAYSLFIGPEVRALAYASEELVEWWTRHPRLTFEQYERSRVESFWGAA